MKKHKKKVLILASAAVFVIACALVFLLKGGTGGQKGVMGMGQGAPGQQVGQKADITVVKAAEPVTGNLQLVTGLTGTVEPSDVVYVYAKASGDVTDVKVKAGDVVEKGQILFEIDTEQVETAKNSLDSAAVSLSEARSNLNRMKLLYDAGDLSEQEYEQYSNKVKSSELQYQSAQLAYDKQLEYSTVTATISGTIESCDIEVYDRVTQNTQLCVISGAGEKTVSFYVTQRMLENVRVGDELTIEKSGNDYSAYISEVSSMVDSATGLFKVKAQLADTDAIATGSTVKLNLVTDRAENATLIPVDAVYYSGGDAYVYLYKDGRAQTAPVEVGIYDSEYAEIRGGLSADDLVVSTWSSNLYEGAMIQLLDSENQEVAADSGETPAQAAGGAAAGNTAAGSTAVGDTAAGSAAAEPAGAKTADSGPEASDTGMPETAGAEAAAGPSNAA